MDERDVGVVLMFVGGGRFRIAGGVVRIGGEVLRVFRRGGG